MNEVRLPRVGFGAVVMAGAEIIMERGASGFELADLAERLGVETSEVSYWMGDPTEVLIAVMELRKNWFLDQARVRMSALPTQTARLRELVEMTVVDRESTFWIELWKQALRDERARQSRQSLSDEYRKTVAGIIRAGQKSGEFGSASPDKVALVLSALLTGFSVSLTLKDAAVTQESMFNMILDACEKLLSADLRA